MLPPDPEEITEAALHSFDGGGDARLRELMQGLVHHLHAYIREVGLTESEWAAAVAVLTATGHITDARRQEFILWSDTLGVSMLVDAHAHPTPTGGVTESTVLGPFYAAGSPLRPLGSSIDEQQGGIPAWVSGRVLGSDGTAIAGAELDIWQNGENRLYAIQDEDAPEFHLRGRFRTDAEGRYAFRAVRPVPYPIPFDGPVGRMLHATGRHPWRPAHIHLVVTAPGFASLATHIFDAESEYLDRDTVFAVKPSLLRQFTERAADDPDRPEGIEEPWVSLDLDIVLAPAGGRPQEVVDLGRTH